MSLKERLQESGFVQQVREAWGRMPRGRQVLAVTTAVGVLGVLGWIIATGSRVEYAELMRGADAQDTAAVRDALQKQGIPFELGEGGVIRVPRDQIHRARLDVAQAGLPAGGSVGFEIFDKQDFWANTFSQRVNFHRALEGELSRTVNTLDEVQAARVHLVIPKPALFKEEQKNPTASIVVRLKPGRQLDAARIQGMRLLVASAVEGMSPDEVTVLDSGGAALARPGRDGVLGGQERRMEFARSYEGSLESRIISMLEPIAGHGRVIARVSADLDFTSQSETVEEFDSENPAVRSEHRSSESRGRSQPKPSGVPGARGNLPGQTPDAATATENTAREDEIVNYELNKTLRRRDEPPGRIRRLSVAVLLAGRPVRRAADQEDPGAPAFVPFSEEELGRFGSIVQNAVGFDAERGDAVEVINMPFSGIEEETLLTEPFLPPGLVERMLDWGFILLLVAALYFAVARPLLARPAAAAAGAPGATAALPGEARGDGAKLLSSGEPGDAGPEGTADGATELSGRTDGPGAPKALGPTSLDAERAQQQVPAQVAVRLRDRAIALSRSDAKRAAQVIRAWLQTEEQHADR